MKMMLKRVFDGQSDYEVFPDIQPSIVCSWRQKSFRAAIKPHHCGKGGGEICFDLGAACVLDRVSALWAFCALGIVSSVHY